MQQKKFADDFQQKLEMCSDGTRLWHGAGSVQSLQTPQDSYCRDSGKEGTGVWQEELKKDELVLFRRLLSIPPGDIKGFGTRFVQAFIEQCSSESKSFFGTTFAAGLTAELPRRASEEDRWHEERIWIELFMEDVSGELKIAAVQLWRSLGFRQ